MRYPNPTEELAYEPADREASDLADELRTSIGRRLAAMRSLKLRLSLTPGKARIITIEDYESDTAYAVFSDHIAHCDWPDDIVIAPPIEWHCDREDGTEFSIGKAAAILWYLRR